MRALDSAWTLLRTEKSLVHGGYQKQFLGCRTHSLSYYRDQLQAAT